MKLRRATLVNLPASFAGIARPRDLPPYPPGADSIGAVRAYVEP